MEPLRFRNRQHAGEKLADVLSGRVSPDFLVLGVPRGGVPVARAVADRLRLPLDLFVIRPVLDSRTDVLRGAATSGGVFVPQTSFSNQGDVYLAAAVAEEFREVARRERRYRGEVRAPAVVGKRVVLVDDGLAPPGLFALGLTALRELGAARVVAAVPVAHQSSLALWGTVADDVVCCSALQVIFEIGLWYQDFSHAVTDREIRACFAPRTSRAA